jgi:hypothetical protein
VLKSIRNHILLALLGICSFSCSSSAQLSVMEHSLNHERLASYIIGTPDPREYEDYYGQKLIIDWEIPKKDFEEGHNNLEIAISFKNDKRIVFIERVNKRSGTYTYLHEGPAIDEDGMLLTYRVLLQHDEEVLEEWRHHTWAPYIDIALEEEEEEEIREDDDQDN